MVSTKETLKKLWNDSCSIYTYGKTVNATTKRTEFTETVLYQNKPCKLSFDSLSATTEDNHAPKITQGVKLFVDNTLSIPDGSKVVVTRGSKTFTYKSSGEPGVFSNHQEINLELFKGWA